jgi:RNA polymerase sigma-70 factor, ECF subfamily
MTPPRADRTDSELVRAAQAGDTASFGALIERHLGMVYAIALARLRDAESADDLAQEVFLRAQLHLSSLGSNDRFAAWVSRIARNLAIDWLRRGQRASRLLPMVSLGEDLDRVPDTEQRGAREAMESKEEAHALREAIFDLPEAEREVVLLHFSEGLSQREIAERLGLSQPTVSRQIQRALDALRGALGPALREMAPSLRVSQRTMARTLMIATAVGALSVSAKATLASSAAIGSLASATEMAGAGAAGAVGVVGLVKSLPTLIAGGAKVMATGKGIAATVAAVVVIAGAGIYHSKQSSVDSETRSAPGASGSGSQQTVLDRVVASETPISSNLPIPDRPGVFALDESGSLTELVPIDNARLGQIMYQFQGGADPLTLLPTLTSTTVPRSVRLLVRIPEGAQGRDFLIQQVSMDEVTQMAPTMDRNQAGASMPFSRTVPHTIREFPGQANVAELVLGGPLTGDVLVIVTRDTGGEVVRFAQLTGSVPQAADLSTPEGACRALLSALVVGDFEEAEDLFLSAEQHSELARLMGHSEDDLPPPAAHEQRLREVRRQFDALSAELRDAESVEFLDMGESNLTPPPQAEWYLPGVEFHVALNTLRDSQITTRIFMIDAGVLCFVDDAWHFLECPGMR